jgi:hypothetical protein
MAGPRFLDPDRLSLTDLYFEWLYTTLRIRRAPEAKALVADADKLLTDIERVLGVERTHEEAVVDGEVAVDWRNFDLDAGVGHFRNVLAVKRGGRPGQELFDRFFRNKAPHEVIRLALRPELALVGPWVASLKADADIDLSAQGMALGKLVDAGVDAVAVQDRALQAMRDFRAGPRLRIFEEVNAARQSVHGEISKLGQPKEWVASFFRPARRRRENPALTLVEAQAQLAEAQAQLAEAQAAVEEVKKREEEAALKAADRAKKQQALEEAQRQDAELKRRIAELQHELED